MKTSKYLALILILVLVCGASLSAKGKFFDMNDAMIIDAAYIYPYIENQIYKVYCRTDRVVEVQLQPGEEITFIGGSDTKRWILDQIPRGAGIITWHVGIKPAVEDPSLSASINIYTNRHIYHLEVYVAPTTKDYTPIVGWNYPQDEKFTFYKKLDEEAEADVMSMSLDTGLSDVNFNYGIYRARKFGLKPKYKWTPKMVFDDGQKTYIQMPDTMASGDAPTLFIKEQNKLELVNYRVLKNYYIVDRLFDNAEMRNGQEVVRIKRK